MDAIRMLCLGDSYTIGEGVSPEERWPNQVADLLQPEGIVVNALQIVAVTGWTTVDLKEGIEETELTPPYDLVTLLIGVNDQYSGLGIAFYRAGFSHALDQAISLAGDDPSRVIVLSIPDYSVTPFGQRFEPGRIRREIDQFNDLNRSLSQEAGVAYVDVTPVSRQAADDLTLLADDELHPAGKMYAEWARLVLPVALTALGGE